MNLRKIIEDDKVILLTKNLSPGYRVYNEDLFMIDGEEYRSWDPYRSKLAAAILKGLPENVVKEGDKVLYLGTSTGTTASHISDLIGKDGILIGVEFSPRVAREFIEKVARRRANVIPYIADARDPSKYSTFGKVDLVYCDVAQPDQTEIAIENCKFHLKNGGKLILIVKSRSIDVTKDPKSVFNEEMVKLRNNGFDILQMIDLSPYDKDHALIVALKY